MPLGRTILPDPHRRNPASTDILPTPNLASADLLHATRRVVDDTRLLIHRLQSDDGIDKVLCAIGTAQRQLRRTRLCLLNVERVLNANPGLFGICEHGAQRLEGDVTYRRFVEGLRGACSRPHDEDH
jgi:hypothetical protein